MKKILNLLTIAVLLMAVLTSCNKDVAVTGVKLDETSLTLGVGESKTLIATVLPEKATNKLVTWTSSNILVASVMPNGLVTGIIKGEATIVVTTSDGSFTASCLVKVDDISVTGITLNKTTLPLEVGKSETLIATVQPEGATNNTVIWTSSDNLIATVANGFVTAIGNGLATVTATTFEGNYTATCTVMVGYKLPAVSTFSATGIIHNKATLGGNITDVGFPSYTEKGICFSLNQNPTTSDSKLIVAGSGTGYYSTDATDLSENTTYYVRAYAINTLGIAYGEQISFTTTDLSQSAAVRFEVKYNFLGYLKAMGVFNIYGEELVSFYGNSISPYFMIPSGTHIPKWYYYNSYMGIDRWENCLSSPYTYNFQVGRKYTVISAPEYGSQYPAFSVTDDGPM
jgi:hypothetical protein